MIKSLLLKYTYAAAVTWALIIFGLCAMPGRLIPSVSWLDLLSFDKFIHAAVFFVLVALLNLAVAVNKQSKMLFIFYCILSVFYGGLLELLQASAFSERSADWNDVIANAFGCLLAMTLSNKLNALTIK